MQAPVPAAVQPTLLPGRHVTLVSPLGGLLTGADPGGECRGTAHGEGGRTRAPQAAAGDDVVGVGAGKLRQRLGPGTCTAGPMQRRTRARILGVGGGAGAPEAEGRESRAAEWTIVGGRRPLWVKTLLKPLLSQPSHVPPTRDLPRPLPTGPNPRKDCRANAPYLLLPAEVDFLREGAFALQPHGLPRPAATALCRGGMCLRRAGWGHRPTSRTGETGGGGREEKHAPGAGCLRPMLKWGCGEDSRTEASGTGYLVGPGTSGSVKMGGRRSSPDGKQALRLGPLSGGPSRLCPASPDQTGDPTHTAPSGYGCSFAGTPGGGPCVS